MGNQLSKHEKKIEPSDKSPEPIDDDEMSTQRTPKTDIFGVQRGIMSDEETDKMMKLIKFLTPPTVERRNRLRVSSPSILFKFGELIDNHPVTTVIGYALDLMLKYLVTLAGGIYGTTEIAVLLYHPKLSREIFLSSRTVPNLNGFVVQDGLADRIPHKAVVMSDDVFKLEIHVFNAL